LTQLGGSDTLAITLEAALLHFIVTQEEVIVNIDAFLQYLRTEDRADRTIDGYTRDLANFLAWFEQTTGRQPQPAIITPLDIRAYRHHLQHEKRMKPASVNRHLAALRVYFRWAAETDLITSNPATSIRMVPPSTAPVSKSTNSMGPLL